MKRLAVALGALVLAGCSADPRVVGSVGVFYGGQVQELEVLTQDPLRAPSFGVHLEIPAAAQSDVHEVRWEVVRPGPAGRRVTQIGEFRVESGRAEIQQQLPVDLRESIGLMNVRVLVDGQVVVDRAIDVRKP